MTTSRTLWILLGVCLIWQAARADIVVTTTGSRYEGVVNLEDDFYVLTRPGDSTPIRLPRITVKEVIRAPLPAAGKARPDKPVPPKKPGNPSKPPRAHRAGAIRFANGTSRRFRHLAGVRISVTNNLTGRETVDFTRVENMFVFRDETGKAESEIPLAQVSALTIERKGEEHLAIRVVSVTGKKETLVSTGFVIQVDWDDTIASHRIVMANHEDCAKYLGMRIAFAAPQQSTLVKAGPDKPVNGVPAPETKPAPEEKPPAPTGAPPRPGPASAREIGKARTVVARMARAVIARDVIALAECYGVSDRESVAKFRQVIDTFHDMSSFCGKARGKYNGPDVFLKAMGMSNGNLLTVLALNSRMSNYELLAAKPDKRAAVNVKKSQDGLVVFTTHKVKGQSAVTHIPDVHLKKVNGQWCILSGGLWQCNGGIPTKKDVRFLSIIHKTVNETGSRLPSGTGKFLVLLNKTLVKHHNAAGGDK